MRRGIPVAGSVTLRERLGCRAGRTAPAASRGRMCLICRVDLLGRSLDARPDAEPATALRDRRSAAHTASAKALAAKAAILIGPHQLVGRVAWPEDGPSR